VFRSSNTLKWAVTLVRRVWSLLNPLFSQRCTFFQLYFCSLTIHIVVLTRHMSQSCRASAFPIAIYPTLIHTRPTR